MDTQHPDPSRNYFTREEGAIPVRTKEWPEIVRFLAAEPVLKKAMHLYVAEGLTVEQAARRVGVHISLLAGWLQATNTKPAARRVLTDGVAHGA